MKAERITPKTFDEYIALFPDGTQIKLKEIRAIIRDIAPGA